MCERGYRGCVACVGSRFGDMIIMPIQWVKYTRESAIVIAQDYGSTLQPVLCVTTSVCVRYLKNLPLLNLVAYKYSKIVTIILSTLTVQSCIFLYHQ